MAFDPFAGAPRGSALTAAKGLVGQDSENSTFQNILRFVSRPGYAFRSALAGDFEGALRNIGQFLVDAPTGGFINRDWNLLSIANTFIPEEYEIPEELTSRTQRPEGSDLLDRWGVQRTSAMGSGEKLFYDLVVGTLTDPLTFLTGPGKTLGQGALKGVGRAAAQGKVLGALSRTTKGLEAVAEAKPLVAEGLREGSKLKALLPRAGEILDLGRKAQAGDSAALAGLRSLIGKAATPDQTLINQAFALNRFLDKRAAEQVFFKAMAAKKPEIMGRALKFAEEADAVFKAEGGLDAGLKALEEASLIPNHYWKFAGQDIPITWNRLGRFMTAPGWAREAVLHSGWKEGKNVVGFIDEFAENLYSKVTAKLFDKRAAGGRHIVQGLRDEAEKHSAEFLGRARELDANLKSFSSIPEAEFDKMGKVWDEFQEIDFHLHNRSPERVASRIGDLMVRSGEAPNIPVASTWKKIRDRYVKAEKAVKDAKEAFDRTINLSPGTISPEAAELATRQSLLDATHREFAQATSALESDLARVLADPGASEKAVNWARPKLLGVAREKALAEIPAELRAEGSRFLDLYVDQIMTVPRELKQVGRWEFDGKNPFYLPRQASLIFHELLDVTHKDVELSRRLGDVMRKAGRDYNSAEEFTAALAKLAEDAGLNVDGLVLQDTNMPRLLRRRMLAHYKSMSYLRTEAAAKRLQKIYNIPEPKLAAYLDAQFAPVRPKEGGTAGVIAKFLAGGEFRVDVTDDATGGLVSWAKGLEKDKEGRRFLKLDTELQYEEKIVEGGKKIRTPAGKRHVLKILWPGLNSLYKPLQTSIALDRAGKPGIPLRPSFHVRNHIGAMTMAAFSPDIGLQQGAKAFAEASMNGPLVRMFGKDYDGSMITDVARFLNGDTDALARLAKNPAANVGNYSWQQVGKELQKHLGDRVSWGAGGKALGGAGNVADIMDRMSEFDYLGREIFENGPWISKKFRRMVKAGHDLANEIEVRHRAFHFLDLIKRGIDPAEASSIVGRAFVDYSTNSTTEWWIRQFLPFSKFAMGSALWAKSAAERPFATGLTTMARIQGSFSGGEAQFLPERAEDSLALPLPWLDAEGNQTFLLGLGLPLETTLNIMGANPLNPQGARRQILGALNPAVALPLEYVADRDFYFGDEFGNYRTAPEWIPRAMTKKIVLPNGKVRYEISGTANKILSSLPTSALDSMVNKLFATNRGWLDKTFNTLTGVRTMSIDQEREFKLRLQDYLKDKARSGQVGETLVYFARKGEGDMPEDLKVLLASLGELKAQQKKRQAGVRRGFGF